MISEEVTRLSHAQGDADAQQAMLARIQKYNRQLVLVAKKMTLLLQQLLLFSVVSGAAREA